MKRHIFLICVLGFALSGCTEALVNRGEVGPGGGDAAEVDAGYEGDVDEEGSGDGDGADGSNGGDATGPGGGDTTGPGGDATGPGGGDTTGPGGDEGPGEDPGPQVFVRFVKPTDGARVRNPVQFKIEAQGVETVQVEVDNWPLRHDAWDPRRTTEFEYTMTGVNKERTGVLFGYDADGEEIARDTIRFFVEEDAPPQPDPEPQPPAKGTSMGKFKNTYYYIALETDHSGAKNKTFYDRNCNALVKVSEGFAAAANIEGSAELANGKIMNYATANKCGGRAQFTWQYLDRSRFRWGMGNRNNALEPFVSLAVDRNLIPNNTILYIEEFDGFKVPKVGELGGFTHDGCFRSDDVGGWIKNNHLDVFVGYRSMQRKMEQYFPSNRENLTVYKNSPRCAHMN